MRVRWTARARREFNLVLDYLEEHQTAGLDGVRTSLRDAGKRLGDFPQMGIEVEDDPTARYVIVGRYRIYYEVLENAVVVLRIRDGRRDPNAFTIR